MLLLHTKPLFLKNVIFDSPIMSLLIQLWTKFSGFSSFHSYRQYLVSDLDHFNAHYHKSLPAGIWNFLDFSVSLFKPTHSFWANLIKNTAFFHFNISSKFSCSWLFPSIYKKLSLFSLNWSHSNKLTISKTISQYPFQGPSHSSKPI